MGGGGGTGGGSPTCMPACPEWEACSNGVCVAKVAALRWVGPANGAKVKGGSPTALEVEALMPDGGRYVGADLSLVVDSQGGRLVPLTPGPTYVASVSSPVTTRTWPLEAHFAADAGPVATSTVNVDADGPAFTVAPVLLPAYADGTGFVNADPTDAGMVKKDEVVMLRVTSPDVDVDVASVVLAVRGGGQAWTTSGAPASCSAAPFCRDYALELGPQPMDAFAAAVEASVRGADDVGKGILEAWMRGRCLP